MIKIRDIAFSCYAVTDMARSRKFYEEVLGLKPSFVMGEPGGMQWTEYDIGHGTVSLGCAPGFEPNADGCSVAFEVEDFDAAILSLREAQVKFRLDPMPTPVCHLAMIMDPDGNTICIHRRKSS
jgi:predicted enzyme related to lactoylglutathione lyase